MKFNPTQGLHLLNISRLCAPKYTKCYGLNNQHDLRVWGGGGSSLDTEMMCVGDCEKKPLIHKNFVEKIKYICTDNRLENGLMYLY